MKEQQLIQLCKQQDRKAQKELYERYSPKMFGVCRRYIKDEMGAEDVLVEGFFKVFSKLDTFNSMGSFEGWIRRIMVNECLMKLRKKHNFNITLETGVHDKADDINVEDRLAEQDILSLLEKLPTGYRTVFNLYVIEGYKHREIAEILSISVNTSKSQLILAKKRLKTLVMENLYPDVG